MLHSFRYVRERFENVRLRIVTDGSFEEYELLASSLGVRDRIDILSANLGELPGLLAEASVALNPRAECPGVPQKLLNHMGAGKPIVSFAGSGQLLEHGRTGCLAPDGDAHEFAAGAIRLLGDPALAHKLGAAARQEAAARHCWGRTAGIIEGVYSQLISEPK